MRRPAEFADMTRDLFRAMQAGGRIGFERVEWFNGGLFDSDAALPLDLPAIERVLQAARLDWSEIDPSIFGTLFERGLDPDKVNLDAEALGLDRQFPSVGPECAKGIEINPYAAELARVTVWIGEIQWMRRNGFEVSREPILRSLDTIECRDALVNPDGSEAPPQSAGFPAAGVATGHAPVRAPADHRAPPGAPTLPTPPSAPIRPTPCLSSLTTTSSSSVGSSGA